MTWPISFCCFYAGPREITTVGSCKHFKVRFADNYSLVDLVDSGPIGFQGLMFWDPISQGEVGSPDVGSKPFTPWGEAGICEFPPGCVLPCWM